ncbi:metallopeptidase family protein [Qipengyuania oceanensis]|uniref:Neutral zinc metallopeptidase n=1 Tax=Qipengyuania oceanensis TaxID=1463597 RepID=A0A844YD58_9SPHN|nr:metallopeptidase family protein [Qipengyuania oceanensis]MXO61485.1 neutral zinc metallopeptidase [Qipengyuania oceanensis]
MSYERAGDPDIATFERLADAALRRLPAKFREQLVDVALRVVDFATPEQLAAVDLDDKWELSGLYEGVPLPEQSQWDPSEMPPRIWLFRMPLIAEWEETGVDLADLVTHVVVHEAGHHFGFSDDDMHALEDEAD